MANLSTMTNAIRQQIYDKALQTAYQEVLHGTSIFKDMTSRFPDGDTFNVTQIGQVAVMDYTDDTNNLYQDIDLSRITLSITDYKHDGFYFTDAIKQDSHQAGPVYAERVAQSLYAFRKDMEAAAFQACNDVQTAGNSNAINGQPHRFALADTASAQDIYNKISDMKLSLNKASVPQQGRVLFVDSTVTNVLEKLGTSPVLVADSPRFEGLLETGFSRNNHYVRNILGFDVIETELLPDIASETVDGVTINNGKCNIAMCLGEDDKAIMGVIRQRPTPEFMRDPDAPRDLWRAFSRYGFSGYRPESLVCLLTEF